MPTEYIHEDHVATGSDLVFPNVQSCAAIIATFDGTMILGGYHITIGSTAAELTAACQHMTTTMNGNPAQVYVIGNVQRTGCSGVGGGATLFTALRAGLGYNGVVRWWQSSPTDMAGIAVQFRRDATPMHLPELRIATPGQWATAANAAPSDRVRYVRRAGTVAGAARFATMATATIQGGVAPWHIGSLDAG